MKRSFVAILVSLLAVAFGVSMTAVAAAEGGATAGASAKKKAGAKKKACPTKKKGKAKKKAKGKNCKATKKGKKGKTTKPAGFANGLYGDKDQRVQATFSGGASKVTIAFVVDKPVLLQYTVNGPVAKAGSSLSASGTTIVAGGDGTVTWKFKVDTKTLKYVLDVDLTVAFFGQAPIREGRVFKGTLKRGVKIN